MDTSGVIQLIILLLLLILSGFFSSAETAISSVNRVRIRSLAEEQNKRAILLQKILDQNSKILSTILIGNNIANIAASSITTTFVIKIWGNYAIGIATGILTGLVLIFGEIVPKTMALNKAEKIALNYAPILHFLLILFTPLVFLIDSFSNAMLRLLGIENNQHDAMTETDLKTYVAVGHEDGVLEQEEREMILNVVDMDHSNVKDVMIPRINMVSIEDTCTYEECLNLFRESMYTRIPVYHEEPENIIGLIKNYNFIQNREDFSHSSILRKAHFTFEYKNTSDLMMELRQESQTVSFVLNEYGSCVGMVTMEDLLEEIVGEIRDEYDEDEENNLVESAPGVYVIEGSMKLDDINDRLGTTLESEDYDSIGGILFGILDRVPENGDQVTTDEGILLTALSVDQNRITKVQMELPGEPQDQT
ncbi:MAG: hemolysin family protein [Lachnospiraceae bacterium]|nr:hemolysin family protein [Lachnospiraceae bacterium]